jgi:hypothetical protein
VSEKGPQGKGRVRLSQEICVFCLQTLNYNLGKGERNLDRGGRKGCKGREK